MCASATLQPAAGVPPLTVQTDSGSPSRNEAPGHRCEADPAPCERRTRAHGRLGSWLPPRQNGDNPVELSAPRSSGFPSGARGHSSPVDVHTRLAAYSSATQRHADTLGVSSWRGTSTSQRRSERAGDSNSRKIKNCRRPKQGVNGCAPLARALRGLIDRGQVRCGAKQDAQQPHVTSQCLRWPWLAHTG